MAREYRIAVVGAGPAGFYATDALLKQSEFPVRVDLFDRLHFPYGLVRYGVAPDHQNIKAVTRVFDKAASAQHFRFFGGVELGTEFRIEDLHDHYDAVLLTTGCASDKPLGIAGDTAPGSYSATEFVAWYNGHPDYQNRSFRLDTPRVAVVGAGNVALDVARILVRHPNELAPSDITHTALEALRRSAVREVVLVARRGAEHAAFAYKELQELGSLSDVELTVSDDGLPTPEIEAGLEPDAAKIVAYLRERVAHPLAPTRAQRRVHLQFLASPVEFLTDAHGVTGLKLVRNVRLPGGGIQASRQLDLIDTHAVFRSIGYRAIPIEGVPFDAHNGTIPHKDGRVCHCETKQIVAGLYVAGWAKRGPSGLIGTNKPDAVATVNSMLADLPQLAQPRVPQDIELLLRIRGLRHSTWQDWQRADAHELERGRAASKAREKLIKPLD